MRPCNEWPRRAKVRNLALIHSSICSNTRVISSAAVLFLPLKVLAFLSNHKVQLTRTMRKSIAPLPNLSSPFLAETYHQSARHISVPEGVRLPQPQRERRLNQTSLEYGQPMSKWVTVSEFWSQSTQLSSSCSWWFFLRAAVQHRSWSTSLIKNLHFAGALVLCSILAPGIANWPAKKTLYAEAVEKRPSYVQRQISWSAASVN